MHVERHRGTTAVMAPTLLAWVAGSAAGVLVMSLPERGDRVFSFSATHGPSVVDLIGVGLLVAAWLPVVALLWSGRGCLRSRAGLCAGTLAAVGLGVLSVSIAGDTGREWLLGVALLVLGQLLAVRTIAAGAAR
jgi:hypothetical protein